jgi:YedE family putative selenium metabolism protein
MSLKDRHIWTIVATGAIMGVLGVMLSVWGNPENSGICISCFIENSAGALGFHDNSRMQYLRPELLGFVLGATATALFSGEFRSRGGSGPMARVAAGIFLIVGCAVFIGCPVKLALRLTAGDLTALAGVVGLFAGVWMGLKGFAAGIEMGSAKQDTIGGGMVAPIFFGLLLLFLILKPSFLLASSQGGAARHAPLFLSLAAGLLLGGLAQRSRFCITGSIRDTLLMGFRKGMPWGLAAFFGASVATNIYAGRFNAGFAGQPGSHNDYIWSFLGMALVGWISVLIGGCPFRQLIKSGEGDGDAGLVVMGMFIGGAAVQSWELSATAAGVPLYGKMAVLAGFAFVIILSLLCSRREA